jgi:hypothetical protein
VLAAVAVVIVVAMVAQQVLAEVVVVALGMELMARLILAAVGAAIMVLHLQRQVVLEAQALLSFVINFNRRQHHGTLRTN